jgi:hypothetical protein
LAACRASWDCEIGGDMAVAITGLLHSRGTGFRGRNHASSQRGFKCYPYPRASQVACTAVPSMSSGARVPLPDATPCR